MNPKRSRLIARLTPTKEDAMRLPILAALTGFALLTSGCYVRTYPATRVVTTTTSCDPRYPCANTYYWDEWRACYV